MKRLFFALPYLILLLSFSNAFAQQKIIRPKRGELVFVSVNIKENKELLEQTMKENQRQLVTQVLAAKEKGGEIDSATLKRAKGLDSIQLFGLGITEDPTTYHHIYEDSLIRSYQSNNGDIIGDYTLIDQKKSTFVMQAKIDRSMIYIQPEPYVYVKNKDIAITEFRNQRKNIQGYDCFKVIYKYKIDGEDGDLPPALANEFQTTEFWVTEKIQSLFHPVCREKEILVKYFPLQIIESSPFFKGMITAKTLKSITISN